MTFTINPSFKQDFSSGYLDYYTFKAISEALVEGALLPVSPLVAIGLGAQSLYVDPLLALATGGIFKLIGRKDTLITPKVLSGQTNQQRSGAMLGASLGNMTTALLPIPFANSTAVLGGQFVGNKILASTFSEKTSYF